VNTDYWDTIAESTVCIVPVYNEAAVVSEVVDSLRQVFPHILCIDDGSSDGSGLLARKSGARVVTHVLNIGQGGALQTGFSIVSRENRYSFVVTFDADGQHSPSDAKRLVLALVASDAEIVFGSRFLETSSREIPLVKRVVLKGLVKFNQYVTDVRLSDAHNGLRAIRVDSLPSLSFTHYGMAHATEIVSKSLQANLCIKEIPMNVRYTAYSRKKGQSIFNSINILFDFLWR